MTPEDPASGPPSGRVAQAPEPGEAGPVCPPAGPAGNTEDREYPHPAEVSLPGPLRTSAVPGETSPPLRRSVPRGVAAGMQMPAGGAVVVDAAPLAGLQARAAKMSERQLETGIRAILADLPSLRWYHTFDSRRSPSGFPDLVIVGDQVIYRELKTAKGKVTAAQAEWLHALVLAEQDACVWRPADLLSGLIGRRLAALAGLRAATA